MADVSFINAITRMYGPTEGPEQLRALLDDAEHVERLVAHHGWAVVQRVIGWQVEAIDARLDGGPAKEAADYAKEHGRRSALRSSEEAARAFLEVAARERQAAESRAERQEVTV